MQIKIKATNLELTGLIKNHIKEKLGSLDKYFDNIQQVEVEVGKTTTGQQKGEIFFCEVNVSVPGDLLRYRQEMENIIKAVNVVKKGIQNEIKAYKGKLNS